MTDQYGDMSGAGFRRARPRARQVATPTENHV
jgi:hypothetical protein